jgi:hypothetical protein
LLVEARPQFPRAAMSRVLRMTRVHSASADATKPGLGLRVEGLRFRASADASKPG